MLYLHPQVPIRYAYEPGLIARRYCVLGVVLEAARA